MVLVDKTPTADTNRDGALVAAARKAENLPGKELLSYLLTVTGALPVVVLPKIV
jgi:hypothetical protein